MAARTHPVLTGGVRFKFEADLQIAADALRRALVTADSPIMRSFLEPIGRADTLIDLNEAAARLANILSDLDALPAKVEFANKEG